LSERRFYSSSVHLGLEKGLLSNWRLLAAQVVSVCIIALISYAHSLQEIFNTAPLTSLDWVIVTGFGALLFGAEEIRKAIFRARRKRHAH
jgi:magnesium-transporting ATPase (P-type)